MIAIRPSVADAPAKIEITRTCPMCGQVHSVFVTQLEYDLYMGGMLIQNAFPNHSAAEREIIKTGICDDCWNNLFQERDDL